jgi:hypothetical protein
MRKIAVALGIALMALGAGSAPALAHETRCVGFLSGTFDDVLVPRDADCSLSFSTVRGNVKALRGSSLFMTNNGIAGNVDGVRPRWIGSLNDSIGGNFSVTGATGPGFPFLGLSVNAFICNARLPRGNVEVKRSTGGTVAVGSLIGFCPGNAVAEGNVKVEQNVIPPPEQLAVARNTVGGNVQVFKNRGQGQKTVAENTVGENLQCKRNHDPFVGAPNVARNAEGQCAATPPGAPRTLSGETLSQHTPFAGMPTGNCNTDPGTGETSYSFDFAGIAVGPYPGTFTEHVEVSIGPATAILPLQPFPDGFPPGLDPSQFLAAGQLLTFDASFQIQSPAGAVSGTKTLAAVVPADATHAGVCAEFANAPSPVGPVSGAYKDVRAFDLDYEATITTSDGTFRDDGRSRVQGRQGRIVDNTGNPVSDVNDFAETFQSRLTEPVPAGG